MKYSVGIIILAVFISQNEATPARDVRELYLKSRDIRSSLELYKVRMIPEENGKFAAVEQYQNEMAELYVDNTFASIETEDHEDCMSALKIELDSILMSYRNTTEDCIRKSTPHWGMIIAEMNDLITKGLKFEAKVDGIESTCADHNAGIFEQCLDKYVPELKDFVVYYQDREARLKTEVQVFTGLGFAEFGVCNKSSTEEFRKRLITADEDARECIKVE
ncbi:uncharacterized protein [Fopius arisanus]|uniref:Protein TsetseEP domain-containing protein n=1 Tax=Fopius arisanus TaxID=64838 RepID=A0A9R1T5A7_9HYME|nr:PREDICTED: uncharacterized protein LOC105266529 [Fopius arisanus]